jgi:hypothetical protein
MAQLTHQQYDLLEQAITDRRRVAIQRRGIEYIVIPTRLRMAQGREVIDAARPATGNVATFYIDEIDEIHIIP